MRCNPSSITVHVSPPSLRYADHIPEPTVTLLHVVIDVFVEGVYS